MSFTVPQMKKSHSVKSEEREGHAIGPSHAINLSPNVTVRWFFTGRVPVSYVYIWQVINVFHNNCSLASMLTYIDTCSSILKCPRPLVTILKILSFVSPSYSKIFCTSFFRILYRVSEWVAGLWCVVFELLHHVIDTNNWSFRASCWLHQEGKGCGNLRCW